jgi:hypothetical protein
MPGKQAKVITPPMLKRMLRRVSRSSFPARDRAMILLSAKAGLRDRARGCLRWDGEPWTPLRVHAARCEGPEGDRTGRAAPSVDRRSAAAKLVTSGSGRISRPNQVRREGIAPLGPVNSSQPPSRGTIQAPMSRSNTMSPSLRLGRWRCSGSQVSATPAIGRGARRSTRWPDAPA